METQNVSAQIYFKQLPPDPTNPNDTNIEGAFQSQLDLSEYYKSPGVFTTMKKTYMDQTMEGSESIEETLPPELISPQIPTPKLVPSGPQLPTASSKSYFGSSTTTNYYFLIIGIILLMLFIYLKK